MTATVQDHYTTDSIAARILGALRTAKGADVPITPDTLAPLDQFHGRGVLATEEMVALLAPQPHERVLDIGCGVGGPARWIAARFGCHVTGVDLTEAFCIAADVLNIATGLSESVSIQQGSALALPFADAAFDRAFSQNVVMNIPDKAGVYREAFRVLKPGGLLALSAVVAGPNGPPFFPVPWASLPEQSFLATQDETRRDLASAGFEIVSVRDSSAARPADLAAARGKIEADGLPPLGLQVLMGPRFAEMMINSLRSSEEGRTGAIEILARRPG